MSPRPQPDHGRMTGGFVTYVTKLVASVESFGAASTYVQGADGP